ncbi:MAG TPA: hypothetical protein VM093_08675 [Aeromicrobium sp.]|nr:hypothetical protein [Aeromicrobium sp.]
MSSFVPRNAETLAERARYTAEGLTSVSCMDCLVTVDVRKNSEHQTAIQWPVDAQGMCPEMARRTGIHESCPRLAASIDAAVRDGRLPVGVGE